MSEYKSKLESKQMDYLCKAILSLENKEECYRFFEDIFTINELKSIEQRLQVAKMLKQKKTYTEIAKETGASTATISRVNRCLNYGSDGYNVVLERIKWE
ncbi:YerC/YecD family TrpR-related protein [Clostridium massiliodielmoense]|uniref:YerC/YecD family TrpR-related protein n=1 Tax=Clostridium massiliodielmoense TaxID=1776385 RepID=UPI0001668BCA|nr:YerC/YecD family TrpR-related protein [Clostridium massiliodielmoense]EDS78069.1 putative TrpR homolog YerC/YecD [Clostridium botulinum C str. Eklund]KEH98491.1 TrpR-like protein YerC/YecD [Clostridium botulinum C/D str. BKT12695]NEZ49030.1 TrpR-like protein YerC/YecD [Clostridium botulinum]